jgi:hypothetical protein
VSRNAHLSTAGRRYDDFQALDEPAPRPCGDRRYLPRTMAGGA